MTTHRDQRIAEFRAAVLETPDLWASLDVRVIALRLGETWHNLVLRAVLDARKPGRIPRLSNLPETSVLACWQEVRPASDLDALIDSIATGCVTVGGHDILLRPTSRTTTGEPAFEDGSYQRANARVASRIPPTAGTGAAAAPVGHVLEFRADSSLSLTEMVPGGDRLLNQTLSALEHPWDGLTGLARVAVRTAHDPSNFDSPIAELVAPLGVAFEPDSVRLSKGRLHATVWAASAPATARCTLGYIAEREDGSYDNDTLKLDRKWRGRTQRRAQLTASVGSDVQRVTLLLGLGPHLVEREEARDSAPRAANPHLAAYLAIDPGLRRLRAALAISEVAARNASEKIQRQFERAVSQLFSLFGLVSDALGGYPGVQDAVDVLVRTADGDEFFPVECTLGALNTKTGKPDRLAARTDQLRRTSALSGATITPMMISSRPRTAILKGDLEIVAYDEMIVLCEEELHGLLTLLERGGTASDAIRFCRQHVAESATSSGRRQRFRHGWPG